MDAGQIWPPDGGLTMSESLPLISLLTCTRNRAALVRATIESVQAQRFESCEHIVLDAMSTDETPQVLAEYPALRVVREPDGGFFDGINKGVRLARGEVIGLINSDDLVPPGALEAVAAAFSGEGVDVVTGACDFFVEEEGGEKRVVERAATRGELELSLRNMLTGNPVLNARFFRKRFMERVGTFDQALPIAGDREWLIRAALANPQQIVLESLVYRYRHHEGSLTIHGTDRGVATYRTEHVAIAENFLARSDLRPSDRRSLKRFHARESAALATRAFVRGELAEVASWARRGCRMRLRWPLDFAQRLAGHALGF